LERGTGRQWDLGLPVEGEVPAADREVSGANEADAPGVGPRLEVVDAEQAG
jgi:hypothetical protein